MLQIRRDFPWVRPAELDDIDDALAAGVIDQAKADALRDQVVLEYVGWTVDLKHDHLHDRGTVTPFLTAAEATAEREREHARAEAKRRERETVQLGLFDAMFGESPTAYDEPTHHPDFESWAILLSEWAIVMGRWPVEADVDAGDSGLPTFEQMSACGGFRRVLDAAMTERPADFG
jgi:hypothetical protein